MTGPIERLKRWFSFKLFGGDSFEEEPEPSPEKRLKNMLVAVGNTQEIEYDCEQVYQLIDQYAEMVERGEDAAALMPLVKHHLDICIACREEYEALMRILKASTASN